MTLILFKSTACLLVLIAFYKIIIEQTSYHHFKRFYLLGSIFIAIGIPFITFIEYIEPQYVLGNFMNPTDEAILFPQIEEPIQKTNYLPIILWSIYVLGFLLFLVRFSLNLNRILLKIKQNPKQKSKHSILILIKDALIPHTFFKYVFVNKTQFENNEIPKEVLIHEETHAKQKHSLDILFVELFQIIFWFNPLIYILKREIKINHEYLSDKAVLNSGTSATYYQNLLLEFSSGTKTNQLAHAINYSSIKKRITIMKTKTSKQSFRLKSILILPLIAVLVYGFSERKEMVKEIIPNVVLQDETNQELTPFLISIEKKDNKIRLKCGDDCRWSDITLDTKEKPIYTINDFGFSDGKTLETDLFAFTIEETQTGISLRSLKGTAWINLEFSLYNNEKCLIDQLGMVRDKPNFKTPTQKEITAYNTWAKEINDKNAAAKATNNKEYAIVKMKEETNYKAIYDRMTDAQRKNAQPWPNFPPPPLRVPSKKEISAYNTWAKKIHDESKTLSNDTTFYPPVDEQELIKFTDIYKRMSSQQKNNAIEFPFSGLITTKNQEQKTSKSKISENKLTVNGKSCEECLFEMTKKEILTLKLSTTTNNDITSFKLKISGIKTQSIKGNRLNDASKKLVLNAKNGDVIQLFDIKVNKEKMPPVVITIIE